MQGGFSETASCVFEQKCLLLWISSSLNHKVHTVCHVFKSISHLRTAYAPHILWHVKQVWFLHLCPPNMFFINNLRLTITPDSPAARQELPGLKPRGLNDSSHRVIRGMQRGPLKALPKNLLEDGGKEKQGVLICLSTDMILKPWYWEPESPWIHISKTLILAPLTAGLAFTLTSRQLLLQISHGNFILLTSRFPPPPPPLPPSPVLRFRWSAIINRAALCSHPN